MRQREQESAARIAAAREQLAVINRVNVRRDFEQLIAFINENPGDVMEGEPVTHPMPGHVGTHVTFPLTQRGREIVDEIESLIDRSEFTVGVKMASTTLAVLGNVAAALWRMSHPNSGRVSLPITFTRTTVGAARMTRSIPVRPETRTAELSQRIAGMAFNADQREEMGILDVNASKSDDAFLVEGAYPSILTTNQNGVVGVSIVMWPTKKSLTTNITGAARTANSSKKETVILPGAVGISYPGGTTPGYCLMVAYRHLKPENEESPLKGGRGVTMPRLFKRVCQDYAHVFQELIADDELCAKFPKVRTLFSVPDPTVHLSPEQGLDVEWAFFFEQIMGVTVPIVNCLVRDGSIDGSVIISAHRELPASECSAAIGWHMDKFGKPHYFNLPQLPTHTLAVGNRAPEPLPAVPASIPEDPKMCQYYKTMFDYRARGAMRAKGETLVLTEDGPAKAVLTETGVATSVNEVYKITNSTDGYDDTYAKLRAEVIRDPFWSNRLIVLNNTINRSWEGYVHVTVAHASVNDIDVEATKQRLEAQKAEWVAKKLKANKEYNEYLTALHYYTCSLVQASDYTGDWRMTDGEREAMEKYKHIYAEADKYTIEHLIRQKELMKEGVSVTTDTQIEEELPEAWLFMDMETFITPNDGCQVYSMVALLHPGGLATLPRSHLDLSDDNPNFFFKANATGKSPLAAFCDWLCFGPPSKYRCHIQAFNGSRFDHILLMQEIQKRGDLVTKSLLVVKNSILSARIRGGHSIHDLSRFLGGSLKSNCLSFKTDRCKVGDFDHNDIQNVYDNAYDSSGDVDGGLGGWTDKAGREALDGWIETNYAKLREYNVMDVLSLAELTYKFESAIDELVLTLLPKESKVAKRNGKETVVDKWKEKPIKLWNFITVASMAQKILKYTQARQQRDGALYPQCLVARAKKQVADVNKRMKAVSAKIEVEDDERKIKQLNEKLATLEAKLNRMIEKPTKPRKMPPVTMASPPESLDLNKWMRKSFYAGRVQNLAPGGKALTRRGIIQMVDICSSYPNVMMKELFPADEYTKTDVEVPGKLGIYNCTIESQNPLVTVPKREDGPLDWSYNGRQENVVLNTVDIDHIRSKGGVITVHDGYYWELSTADQFSGYIKPIFELKKQLDAAAKTPQANPALRAVAKLFLNSISGKVGERPHFDIVRLCGSAAESYAAIEDMDEDKDINFSLGWTNATLIKGKMSEAGQSRAYFTKLMRAGGVSPTITASFVYAYARRNLYTALEYAGEWGYCDTDSCVMLHSDYLRMRRDHPDLFKQAGQVKELGQWDSELIQDGTMSYTFSVKGAKEYAIFPDTPNAGAEEEGKAKIRTKGVSGRDLYIPPDEVDAVQAMDRHEKAMWAAQHQHLLFAPSKSDMQSWDEEYRKPVEQDGVIIPPTQVIARRSFEARTRGEDTHWLCLQFKRMIGGTGAQIFINHVVKKY